MNRREVSAGFLAAALALLIGLGMPGCSKSPQERREAAAKASVRGEAARGQPFVASTGREPFHRSDCKWAARISTEHLAGYGSRDAAIADGHRPCEVCNP